MFDGLTMVSYDGHNRNKMMVDHVWTMVDHGRPWSGGQMFAGANCLLKLIISTFPLRFWFEMLMEFTNFMNSLLTNLIPSKI